MIKTSEVIELKVCTLWALNFQHENCDEFPYWIWKQYWFTWFQNSPWSIRMKHTYVYLLGGERDFSLFWSLLNADFICLWASIWDRGPILAACAHPDYCILGSAASLFYRSIFSEGPWKRIFHSYSSSYFDPAL